MKLTEKQAFEVVDLILNHFKIEYDKMELADFIMLELINKEFSEV